MFVIAGAIYADESLINITGNTWFDHNSAEGETRDKTHINNPVTASIVVFVLWRCKTY